MAMGPEPKKTTDQAMIDEFLNKGGKITKGKTKPMANELGISNNTWNNKLSRDEKKAKDGK
jgi:poly-D-alanine transfer protein DltD